MNEARTTDMVAGCRRASRLKALFMALGLAPVLGLFAAWIWFQAGAGSKLRHAVAEADRLDPGWRLDEIESKRERLADGENSGPRVQAVASWTPRNFLASKAIPASEEGGVYLPSGTYSPEDELLKVEPAVQLDEKQVAELAAELEKCGAALSEADGLEDMPRGRYKVTYATNIFSTLLGHAQNCRTPARLLRFDAMLRAQRGDIDGALRSSRAAMNAGRSLGDEPLAISQLVRMATVGIGMDAIQRALAQGEASDAALVKVQDLLADELEFPASLVAMRGERALMNIGMGRLASGEVKIKDMGFLDDLGKAQFLTVGPQRSLYFRYNQGLTIELMNRAVEIAKLPFPEQAPLWKALSNDIKAAQSSWASAPTAMLLPAIEQIATAHQRHAAKVACALVMVAAERYRLAHGGRWPSTLDDLVPKPLPRPTADPCSTGPIRLKRVGDGLVIYSVGTDGKDDGGNLNNRRPDRPDIDMGFRLWDVAKRRQVPPRKEAPKP